MRFSPARRLGRMGLIGALVVSISLSLAALAPSTADAGILVGVGADAAVPVGDAADVNEVGFGIDGRVGYVLPIPLVDLSVEINGGFTRLSEKDSNGLAFDLGQVLAAAHAAIGLGAFAPEVFAGIGWGSGSLADAPEGVESDFSGLTWLVGAGVDFSGLPLVDLGLHVNYNELHDSDSDGDPLQWVDLGLHVKAVF